MIRHQEEEQTATVKHGAVNMGDNLCEILDVTPGTGKAALKQKYVTTCKCALRMRLSYFILIPLRKSSLNYASSNYTRSCEM